MGSFGVVEVEVLGNRSLPRPDIPRHPGEALLLEGPLNRSK